MFCFQLRYCGYSGVFGYFGAICAFKLGIGGLVFSWAFWVLCAFGFLGCFRGLGVLGWLLSCLVCLRIAWCAIFTCLAWVFCVLWVWVWFDGFGAVSVFGLFNDCLLVFVIKVYKLLLWAILV